MGCGSSKVPDSVADVCAKNTHVTTPALARKNAAVYEGTLPTARRQLVESESESVEHHEDEGDFHDLKDLEGQKGMEDEDFKVDNRKGNTDGMAQMLESTWSTTISGTETTGGGTNLGRNGTPSYQGSPSGSTESFQLWQSYGMGVPAVVPKSTPPSPTRSIGADVRFQQSSCGTPPNKAVLRRDSDEQSDSSSSSVSQQDKAIADFMQKVAETENLTPHIHKSHFEEVGTRSPSAAADAEVVKQVNEDALRCSQSAAIDDKEVAGKQTFGKAMSHSSLHPKYKVPIPSRFSSKWIVNESQPIEAKSVSLFHNLLGLVDVCRPTKSQLIALKRDEFTDLTEIAEPSAVDGTEGI